MRSNFLPCDGPGGPHRMHYLEWGDPDNPRVVVCVHGLTRNAHDFDRLAERLQDAFRVVCVDVAGRGGSDWLRDKDAYGSEQYVLDLLALVRHTGARRVDWVGTSMGGLIGMALAALIDGPIARLVLNDVGPHVPLTALREIGDYVGRPVSFANLDEMEAHMRVIHSGFGRLSDAQWRHLAVHSAGRRDDGRYVFSYDPGIAAAFTRVRGDIDLWDTWERIEQPVLLLRGAHSELLSREIADEMRRRRPPIDFVEFEDVGHAPMLLDENQIGVVADWLGA